MPLVEVVPGGNAGSTAPGWAYVPDTGVDPSKAAIQPTGSRHRPARAAFTGSAGSGADRSARKQTAINKHLADLDKDNHRDVQIPVPQHSRESGPPRSSRTKGPPNVKRILASQKTFVNHLADEEAAIANQTHPSQGAPMQRHANQYTTKTVEPSTTRQNQASIDRGELYDSGNDTDEQNPLMSSRVPTLPLPSELEELLSAPPLPYSAAQAKPSSSGYPMRQFCEICGFWGRARCQRCGARVCGLECKGVHDDGRCLKFYS